MPDSPDWTGNIQISGQSVVVNESISGQTVAVYSGSQYAPVQGSGVYINGSVSVVATVTGLCVSYTVPVGKTLYVQGISHGIASSVLRQNILQFLEDNGGFVIVTGSYQGAAIVFDTPIIFASGHTVTVQAQFYGGTGNAILYGSLWGWVQ